MLAVLPQITAKDRCWWNNCRCLGSPDIPTNFFARLLKKGAVAYHMPSGFTFNCHWLKVVIQGGIAKFMISIILRNQSMYDFSLLQVNSNFAYCEIKLNLI